MTNSCVRCGCCCSLFLINLSKKEYASGRYRTMFQEHGVIEPFAHAQGCGAHLLDKNADESCVYLVAGRCGIHASRPAVCRDFFCTTQAKKFAGMVEVIRQSKAEALAGSGEPVEVMPLRS